MSIISSPVGVNTKKPSTRRAGPEVHLGGHASPLERFDLIRAALVGEGGGAVGEVLDTHMRHAGPRL